MKKSLNVNLLEIWNQSHNVRRIFMKFSAYVLVLLFVHLHCVGCLQSQALQTVQPGSGGLPPLTAMKGTGTLTPSSGDRFMLKH